MLIFKDKKNNKNQFAFENAPQPSYPATTLPRQCAPTESSALCLKPNIGVENYPNHLSLQSYFVVYDLYNKPNKRLKKIPLNHSRQSISLSPNNPTPSLNQIPIPNPKHTSLRLNLKSSPTAC